VVFMCVCGFLVCLCTCVGFSVCVCVCQCVCVHCWWLCNWCSHYGKHYGGSSKVKSKTTVWSSSPLLDIYPKETKCQERKISAPPCSLQHCLQLPRHRRNLGVIYQWMNELENVIQDFSGGPLVQTLHSPLQPKASSTVMRKQVYKIISVYI